LNCNKDLKICEAEEGFGKRERRNTEETGIARRSRQAGPKEAKL
jgi:hypothetical protein